MLSVIRVHIPSDIPIVGCELSPYVLLRKQDKTIFSEDVPETAPIDGHFLRYKWYVAFRFNLLIICSLVVWLFELFMFFVSKHFTFI